MTIKDHEVRKKIRDEELIQLLIKHEWINGWRLMVGGMNAKTKA